MKIGVDPGLTGAIAFVDESIDIFDMPVKPCPWIALKSGKPKMMVDSYALMKMLLPVRNVVKNINIEIVHSMPKQGVASSFTFGGSFYSVVSVAEAMGFGLNMVHPQFWKNKIGATCKGKDYPRQLALKMYPNLDDKLKLKKHQGRADAIFIAVSK